MTRHNLRFRRSVSTRQLVVRSAIWASLGLVACTSLAMVAALDAQSGQGSSESLLALWRRTMPRAWVANDSYDFQSIADSCGDPHSAIPEYWLIRGSFTACGTLVNVSAGRGLFDSIFTVSSLGSSEATPAWQTYIEVQALDNNAWPWRAADLSQGTRTKQEIPSTRFHIPSYLEIPGCDGQNGLGVLPPSGTSIARWKPRTALVQEEMKSLLPTPKFPLSGNVLPGSVYRLEGVRGRRTTECRAYGWPFRSFLVQGVRETEWEYDSNNQPVLIRDSHWTDGLELEFQGRKYLDFIGEFPASGLPVTPVWSLLAANVAVWAFGLWIPYWGLRRVAAFAHGTLRRLVKRKDWTSPDLVDTKNWRV